MAKLKVSFKDVIEYLQENDLDIKQQNKLLGVLNRHLNNFPIKEVLSVSPEGIKLVNGHELTLEQTLNFKQSFDAFKENWAFQLIADQILFNAIKIGIHEGHTPEQLMFSKTAIFFITQFKEYVQKFDI